MKKSFLFVLFLILILGAKNLSAQQEDEFKKNFEKVSKYIPVVAYGKNNLNQLIFYRFGWNRKAPAAVAIQFANLGYGDFKLKFSIKDVTTGKMVILDKAQNSLFGTELLKAGSKGMVRSWAVDNISDGFSPRVWINDGDEIDKDPVSIKDKDKK